jgi:hypothetical protein
MANDSKNIANKFSIRDIIDNLAKEAIAYLYRSAISCNIQQKIKIAE